MNLQWVNGELIDMDAPVYATTASNNTNPVVKQPLTTESLSAGLSVADDECPTDEQLEERAVFKAKEWAAAKMKLHDDFVTSALAQRLREVEARLSTVIRVSQEYASEAAQAQQRIAQLEAQVAEAQKGRTT